MKVLKQLSVYRNVRMSSAGDTNQDPGHVQVKFSEHLCHMLKYKQSIILINALFP